MKYESHFEHWKSKNPSANSNPNLGHQCKEMSWAKQNPNPVWSSRNLVRGNLDKMRGKVLGYNTVNLLLPLCSPHSPQTTHQCDNAILRDLILVHDFATPDLMMTNDVALMVNTDSRQRTTTILDEDESLKTAKSWEKMSSSFTRMGSW